MLTFGSSLHITQHKNMTSQFISVYLYNHLLFDEKAQTLFFLVSAKLLVYILKQD